MDKAILYDRLCDIADKLLAKHSPCSSCPTKCEYFGGKRSGCCTGCPFLGPQGCTIKSLACKLWLCSEASGERPIINDRKLHILTHQLQRLKYIAARNHIHYARATREEALEAEASGISQYSVWWFYNNKDRGPYNERL